MTLFNNFFSSVSVSDAQSREHHDICVWKANQWRKANQSMTAMFTSRRKNTQNIKQFKTMSADYET